MKHLRRKIIWYQVVSLVLLTSMGCSLLNGLTPTATPEGAVSNPAIADSSDSNTPSVDVADSMGSTSSGDDEDDGFHINLSEGSSTPQEVVPIEPVQGEALTQEQINVILARLPEMEMGEDDQVAFNAPPDILPPPRPGETIEQPFPLEEEALPPSETTDGPLEVLRYSPEGEISVAPFISVTFNQPMVPLATLQQLSEADVPVNVEPDLPGDWRWVGTRTLAFYYESDLIDRLPKSTEYVVTVPAGTTSVNGGELAEEVSWTFTTPAPVLVSSYPYSYETQGLEPIFFAAFDQRIDPEAVLSFVQTTADNKPFEVRLATDEELEAEELANLIENTPEGRWLAFTVLEPLPKDSDIEVVFQSGMPSAEGSLTTSENQSYSFRTYPPLKIEDSGCSWSGNDECYPLQPFYIQFNNALDAEAYTEDMISVDPPIVGATVNVVGNSIVIQGQTEASTKYFVTVSGDIEDTFGQTLDRDEKLTFKVGKAQATLIGPDSNLVTVDPYATTPGISVYSITYDELDVQIYAVTPDDWDDFKAYVQEYAYNDKPTDPPGRLVMDDSIKIEDAAKLTETLIDVSEYMSGDYGHFIVIVKPPKGFFEEERYWETVNAWVQVTQIGLDAFADNSQLTVWATNLKDGTPLTDVMLNSGNTPVKSTTDADGIAHFELSSEGIQYLVGSLGDDSVLLPKSNYIWGEDGWYSYSTNDRLTWHIFDDRAMYKPGETVSVKGWLRVLGFDEGGDVELPGEQITSINYSAYDTFGNEFAVGEAEVDEFGGFDLTFDVPENSNLGYAYMQISANGRTSQLDGITTHHEFQIQEFRRPEFEVAARTEEEGPFFVDSSAITAVEANYYAGGSLPNAEVYWNVTSSETAYQPPNWPDYTFGQWLPWWWYDYFREYDYGYTSSYQSFEGRTDATGTHYLKMDFSAGGAPIPQSVRAEAVVMDVNRQSWASTTTLLVHPASVYVGLNSERYFVERGTPLEINVIAVDLDGNPAKERPITVTAERMEWKFIENSWQEIGVDPQVCELVSTGEPQQCSFDTSVGGKYQITALVTDEEGRENQSRFTRWVSGGEVTPSRDLEQEELTLVPDQETYQPGDTAEILVQSPFGAAEGLLTVSRNGILYSEEFSITESSITLEIPILDEHIPNLHIQVDLVGSAERLDDDGNAVEDAPARPAYATGQLELNIPPLNRELELTIETEADEVSPGDTVNIDVDLKDAAGEPVEGASLAVVVVDEAILALTNYQLVDPIDTFYYTRSSDVYTTYGRSSIILVDPMTLAGSVRSEVTANQALDDSADGMAFGGDIEEEMEMEEVAEAVPMATESDMAKDATTSEDSDSAEAETAEIALRTNFNPLALFSPDVRTNANGHAQVEVELPDNLTRYRIMVVAVDDSGRLFGSAEANLTARLPLMVRPSAPRFLNFGDEFELPIMIQNQTDEAMSVDVVVDALNLTLSEDQGLRIEVPANDRVEVRFPAAAELAGNAHLQIAAVSNDASDAAQVSLPVYTPATSEAFAVYGVVDDGAVAQPIAKPEDVFTEYGGLEITTSSTALQSLTDAVLYLTTYPFESSEQLASRILGIAALKDVLAAFEAEGLPTPDEMDAVVTADIEKLSAMQNYDGGFPYWRRGYDSIPFNTVHVANALQRAEEMGYSVPDEVSNNLQYYLTDIENYYPSWYSEQAKWTISAYALYVRDRMGDADPEKASELLDDAGVENISLDGLAFVWQVLVNADSERYEEQLSAIRQHVNNRAVETAGAANFTTAYSDSDYVLLHSNRRTDALLLDALLNDDPYSDLVPKIVKGLQDHRTRGRWGNTQENVFVLLALHRYFETFEAQEPDFVARIWLGETYAGENSFVGYSSDYQEINIPMSYLQENISDDEFSDLILEKDGAGRLYYRLGLRYAPTDLQLPAEDMGFAVQRVYEAVDDPEDVWLDEDGIWHVRLGARVRVRVTLVARNRRYHVALVDPLPAGLEAINPALAVSESVPADPSDPNPGWFWWNWYQHQNLRDERAEAFTSLLWEGTYEYTYVTRATTPGRFVVPPAKAEEMYSPEVFGRSMGDIVIVED